MNTFKLIERLRGVCEQLRRTPMALADLIPTLQEAADALDAQRAAQPADGNIDAAAKIYADCMSYKWDVMSEQGRDWMRANTQLVLDAAHRIKPACAVDAALREAIAQPVQPQRVPLTDEQIDAIADDNNMGSIWYQDDPRQYWCSFARAIEAAHGIKPASRVGAA